MAALLAIFADGWMCGSVDGAGEHSKGRWHRACGAWGGEEIPMTEMPGNGKDEEFRGKWPLPEGARPAHDPESPEKNPEESPDPSFPASDPPSTTPPETTPDRVP